MNTLLSIVMGLVAVGAITLVVINIVTILRRWRENMYGAIPLYLLSMALAAWAATTALRFLLK